MLLNKAIGNGLASPMGMGMMELPTTPHHQAQMQQLMNLGLGPLGGMGQRQDS